MLSVSLNCKNTNNFTNTKQQSQQKNRNYSNPSFCANPSGKTIGEICPALKGILLNSLHETRFNNNKPDITITLKSGKNNTTIATVLKKAYYWSEKTTFIDGKLRFKNQKDLFEKKYSIYNNDENLTKLVEEKKYWNNKKLEPSINETIYTNDGQVLSYTEKDGKGKITFDSDYFYDSNLNLSQIRTVDRNNTVSNGFYENNNLIEMSQNSKLFGSKKFNYANINGVETTTKMYLTTPIGSSYRTEYWPNKKIKSHEFNHEGLIIKNEFDEQSNLTSQYKSFGGNSINVAYERNKLTSGMFKDKNNRFYNLICKDDMITSMKDLDGKTFDTKTIYEWLDKFFHLEYDSHKQISFQYPILEKDPYFTLLKHIEYDSQNIEKIRQLDIFKN